MHKTIEFVSGKKKGRAKKVKFTISDDPFHVHGGKLRHGFPIGLAEKGGFEFDKVFGLGKANLFEADIGIDPNFGVKGFASYDAVESNSFINADFENHPSAIDPVDDIDIEKEYEESAGFDDVPTLLGSVKKIDNPIPLTDKLTKREKLERKFNRVRAEALATGANALSPEEHRNFFDGGVHATRNYATTSNRSVGKSFGRY